MLEYKPQRTEFGPEAHNLARELTEAVNSYLNEIKGDEIKESLDVGMIIGSMLMGGGNKHANNNTIKNTILNFIILANHFTIKKRRQLFTTSPRIVSNIRN